MNFKVIIDLSWNRFSDVGYCLQTIGSLLSGFYIGECGEDKKECNFDGSNVVRTLPINFENICIHDTKCFCFVRKS